MAALEIRKDRTPVVLRKLAKAETDTRVARRILGHIPTRRWKRNAPVWQARLGSPGAPSAECPGPRAPLAMQHYLSRRLPNDLDNCNLELSVRMGHGR